MVSRPARAGPLHAVALALTVVCVSLTGLAVAAAPAAASSPEVVPALESNGDIEIAFDGPVQAADDGGDVGVDDIAVRVRKGGTENFTTYETGFSVTSSSTTEGRVLITDGPWGDLDPVDTLRVNFTTPLENATAGTTNVTVETGADANLVDRYDDDGDGVDIQELGAAAADYVRGTLSITELGTVAAAYAQS